MAAQQFETRKRSKPNYRPSYKLLIFISAIALSLIFFIPIFAQSLLPSPSAQPQISLHFPAIARSLKSGSIEAPIVTKSPKSKKSSINFDQKVRKFINGGPCETLFFMIWISPARLFSNREILSLESLFKSNKHGCLIILSKSLASPTGEPILRPISNLGFRILPIEPNIPLLFKHTPALKWYRRVKRGQIDPGHVPFAQNLSNLMRLVFLYKYGGVYLDTDFVILKNLSGLRNAIGAQSLNSETRVWTRLNNAVLIFEKSHPIVLLFIKEFVARFNGNKWGHNGPYLVSRVMEKIRVAERKRRRKKMEVGEFTVLPPEAFYPVDWSRISGLFERPNNTAQIKWARGKLAQLMSGKTYGVHLWHKRTRGVKIEEGSVMAELISKHCLICGES